jgi:hypothetical protein
VVNEISCRATAFREISFREILLPTLAIPRLATEGQGNLNEHEAGNPQHDGGKHGHVFDEHDQDR